MGCDLKVGRFVFKLVMTFCSLGGFAAKANPSISPSRTDVLDKYSYEQLQDAATYLSARVEQGASVAILSCDPDLRKSAAWLSGPLRSLIDDSKTKILKSYLRNPADFSKQIRNCLLNCRCDSYQALIEQTDTQLTKSSAQQTNKDSLKKRLPQQNSSKALACAKKQTWLCKSVLLKYLESIDLGDIPEN